MAINLYNYKLYEHVINDINAVFDGGEHQYRIMEEIILYIFLRNIFENSKPESQKVNIKALEKDLIGEEIINEVMTIFGIIVKDDIKKFQNTMKKSLSSFTISQSDEVVDYSIVGNKAIIGSFTFKITDKINIFIKEYGEKEIMEYIGNNLIWLVPINNSYAEINILKPLLYKHNIHNIAPSNIFAYNKYLYDGDYCSINGDKKFGSLGNICDIELADNWLIYIPPNYNIFSKIVKSITKTKNKTFILIIYNKYTHLLNESKLSEYVKEVEKFDDDIDSYSIFFDYKKSFANTFLKYVLIKT